MQNMIGSVVLFAGDYNPRGWLSCEGQELLIADYPDLFRVIGTAYGGDGITTFHMPDLRGRAPVGRGSAPDITDTEVGDKRGAEKVAIEERHMPSHSHGASITDGEPLAVTGSAKMRVKASVGPDPSWVSGGDRNQPQGNYIAHSKAGSRENTHGFASTYDGELAEDAIDLQLGIQGEVSIGSTGNSEEVDVTGPTLTMRYIMAYCGFIPCES